METVQRDYAAKGVDFYYIYKSLAHPEQNGYVTPFTLDERLMHVAEAKEKLGSQIQWLCDSMANNLKHALGDAPNSEFVISPDGKIVRARSWSRPEELRKDLAELVGEVTPPTTVAELGMKPLEPPKTAARGVVSRVQLPGNMTPVRVDPVLSDTDSGKKGEPFYVKLRAEVEPSYFAKGEGKLYLGFFLDPLYQVHWNNRAPGLQFEIELEDGIEISPREGKGPQVEPDADADPREFLVDLTGAADRPLRLSVKYFACDDAATFCKPVTQHYEITLQRDRDGGSRRPRGGDRRLAGPGDMRRAMMASRGESGTVSEESRAALHHAVAIFKKRDANENGRLDADELPPGKRNLDGADQNADGALTLRELVDWLVKHPQVANPSD